MNQIQKTRTMLEYNDTYGGERGDDEENFRRYEENHGLEQGKSRPDGELPDPETEDLLEDEAPQDQLEDADITTEDLEALGPRDLSMDGGDDEDLKHRTHPVDFSGDDLDVPGSEADDEAESIGSEDEENNSYSLGGDRHEDAQDENPDVVK